MHISCKNISKRHVELLVIPIYHFELEDNKLMAYFICPQCMYSHTHQTKSIISADIQIAKL